jgi:hypothetical protein
MTDKHRDIQLMRRLARKEEKPAETSMSIFDDDMPAERQTYLSRLNVCRAYWDSLQDVRDKRARTRNYVMNEQFQDTIKDDCGGSITEENYLKNKGLIPFKQNILHPIFNNLKGQFRQSQHKPVVSAREPGHTEESKIMTNTLQGVHELNDTEELDAANLGEFMISGCVFQRLSARWWSDRNQEDIYIENVTLPFMFWNTDVQDVRMHGLKLIGQIHDMYMQDAVLQFSKYHSPEYVKEAFTPTASPVYDTAIERDRTDNLNFHTPVSPGMVRVYEVWTKRTERRIYIHDRLNGTYEYIPLDASAAEKKNIIAGIEAENESRITAAVENNMSEMQRITAYNLPQEEAQLIDETALPLIEYGERYGEFWYVEYITPLGYCLCEGYSPYAHKEHPYVIRLHPLVDGTIHGMLWILLDQQRYVNRLVMLLDMIISSSAKGVLMVPDDVRPPEMTPEEFADAWVRHDGVIYYIPKPHGKMPEQISANSTNIGIHEVIQMQLQWAQDISGVHSAIQGKDPKAGTAASLYAQEAANATLNNLDFITSYFNFLQKRDFKTVKLMQQYYTSPRIVTPAGAPEMDKLVYEPAAVANLEFTNSIDYVQNYSVYAQMVNETMLQLFQIGVIDGKMLLKYSTLPNSEAILQDIAQVEEQMAQMQQQMQAEGVNPQIQQQQQQQQQQQ